MKLTMPPLSAVLILVLLFASSPIGLAKFVAPTAPSEALKAAMHQIDESSKALAKGVTAENRAASLEELGRLQTALLTAKALTPDSAEKVDEKKRAAFQNEFRSTLVETLQHSCTAELAIIEGKYKEADSVLRNKLGAMKSKGHGKFKTDGGY